MVSYNDIKLTCRECGRQFVFSEGEQQFYEQMGFNPPTRCRPCRSNREKQVQVNSCIKCGMELPRGTAVYCATCFKSSSVEKPACAECGTSQEREAPIYCESCLKKFQLEAERKVEKIKKEAGVAQSKLELAEIRNRELERSLCEARQQVADLEIKMGNLNQDLDRLQQFYAGNSWIRPALDNIVERLRPLEQLEQQTATLVHRLNGNGHNGHSLFGALKRLVLVRGKSITEGTLP